MRQAAGMRPAYGEALLALGDVRPDVVALTADVSTSDFSWMFADAYPDRFLNVGIAEQSLVDVAVGVAAAGLVPFAHTFAFLLATRALEPTRTHCCYGGANVKLVGAYAGVSDSFDGPTHHAIADIAILRALPNMTVICPSDTVAVAKLLPQIAEYPGPVYLRLNRNEVPVLFDPERYAPVIGKAMVHRPGRDVTLIGTGLMLSRCFDAADELAASGIDARVIEVHTIKPLDAETIVQAARETGAIVTAEEHTIVGGLGSAVSEVLGRVPVPIERVGIPDAFATSGPYGELLDYLGLNTIAVVDAAHRAMASKSFTLKEAAATERTTV